MTQLRHILVCPALLLLTAAAPTVAKPWFGTWKLRLAHPGEKPETLIYSDAGDGAMRMESVEDGSVLVTHFDGQPAADIGSGKDKGHTLAVRSTSATSYSWTYAVAGKPRVRGVNTLAADLGSFKEVAWPVAQPDKRVTLIYNREEPCRPSTEG